MKKYLFISAAIVIGGILGGVFTFIHPFGNPGTTPMDDYILANTFTERSAQNIVTAMVFDYRGFDTLGEAAVLFTAVCSIGALFRAGRKKK
jgi:multisubunit Na+/H+ antiporter MnhB subunit